MLRIVCFVLAFSVFSAPVLAEEIKMMCDTKLFRYTKPWIGSANVHIRKGGEWVPLAEFCSKKGMEKLSRRKMEVSSASFTITERAAICRFEATPKNPKDPDYGITGRFKLIWDFELLTGKFIIKYPDSHRKSPKPKTTKCKRR